ncbi:MAG TPA: heme exporter protein CcmB [Stellaceae bacterium]|nr:heme exporter protein CcmB [Stellaceae bacterium]
MSVFRAVLRRDLSLAMRQGGDAVMAVLFFVLAAILFPFGVGPEASVLARIAPGVVWVCALLAALLSLDRLFQAEWEDGTLDLLVLSPLPLELIVLAKCLAHWLVSGLPLVLAAPVVALLLQMEPTAVPRLVVALALGTPSLSLLGGMGAALSLGARRGGVLLALLVLPLTVPILIFGAAAVDEALAGGAVRAHFLVLGAFLALALPLCPLAAAAALRQAVE